MSKSRTAPDFWLMASILGLLAIGIVMVYSAGSVLAFHDYGDSFYFVKRQLLFAVLGLVAMFLMMNFDYRLLRKYAKVGLLICFALLVIVLIPGIGVVRGGARSWLGISSFGIQPSEFMKLGMILFLSYFLSQEDYKITNFAKGLLPPLGVIGLAFGLIMLQPDLGTGTVMLGASLLIVFTAGARILHLAGLAGLGALGFVGLILAAPYRLKRITAFLDPWSDPLGAGYQIIQSLYAIGPGGLAGLGLGMSRQKYSYVPEPQTDLFFHFGRGAWLYRRTACSAAVPHPGMARHEGCDDDRRHVRQPAGRRHRRDGRRSGGDQHRRRDRPDARHRHYPAAYQLRRIFADADADRVRHFT
ncbi:hypothetical protein HMSSN036_44780 [Paenibacillus macerans]|nr:hypothetical protein HMSSN036_44780 [Paenibacillus macerans]